MKTDEEIMRATGASDDELKLAKNLGALVRLGDWDVIDAILNGLHPFLHGDDEQMAFARGRLIGIHVGFLNKVAPEVRSRRSFKSLIARYQRGINRVPFLKGQKAETILNIAPLEP